MTVPTSITESNGKIMLFDWSWIVLRFKTDCDLNKSGGFVWYCWSIVGFIDNTKEEMLGKKRYSFRNTASRQQYNHSQQQTEQRTVVKQVPPITTRGKRVDEHRQQGMVNSAMIDHQYMTGDPAMRFSRADSSTCWSLNGSSVVSAVKVSLDFDHKNQKNDFENLSLMNCVEKRPFVLDSPTDSGSTSGQCVPSTTVSNANTKRMKKAMQTPQSPVDDKDGHLILYPDVILASRYIVKRLLGQGTFGKVVEAVDSQTGLSVAVKIIKNIAKYREAAKTEIKVLSIIKTFDPFNLKRCIHIRRVFEHENHVCMVFDLLSQSLFDFFKDNEYTPFCLAHIRAFAVQLLGAVSYLHQMGIIHTDLKPENLMLESNNYQECRLNATRTYRRLNDTQLMLIDFGSAICEQDHHSAVVSTRHYRAPEIILGIDWSFPCDVWSIGCILIELYTGMPLFQTNDNLEHLKMMETILGPFPQHFLDRMCADAKKYFIDGRVAYPQADTKPKSINFTNKLRRLEDLVHKRCQSDLDFYNLVQSMLIFDPKQRISAKKALQHPFFTNYSLMSATATCTNSATNALGKLNPSHRLAPTISNAFARSEPL